jgi:8-oxo-dGTP diphosphatase
MNKRDVSILILQDGDKILLQKRSTSAKRFPGKWGLFGGGVDNDETPEMALRREVREELNLSLSEFDLIDKREYFIENTMESGHIYTFLAKYNNEKLELLDVGEMHWMTLEGTLELDLMPDIRAIINKIGQSQLFMVL